MERRRQPPQGRDCGSPDDLWHLEVKIGYKDETSELYPDPFYICKERAEKYPVQFVKGVKLYLIPLDQMFTSIVEARDDRDRYFEELNV